ncbi:hypothetical protein SFRURICE_018335 [Spodoptera frugiperda]|nr:hypothetical protein SFRURICE_018335 [Spodoptera frugiperda]
MSKIMPDCSLAEWLQVRLPNEVWLGFFRFFENFSVVAWSLELCPVIGMKCGVYSNTVALAEAAILKNRLDLILLYFGAI